MWVCICAYLPSKWAWLSFLQKLCEAFLIARFHVSRKFMRHGIFRPNFCEWAGIPFPIKNTKTKSRIHKNATDIFRVLLK